MLPRQVWLSGLGVVPQTKGQGAWVEDQFPGWGQVKSHGEMFLSHTDVSLPLSLPFSL